MSFAIVISTSAPCGPMLRFSDDKAVVNERMPWHMRSGFVDPWVAVSIYRDYKAVRVAFVQCVIGTPKTS